VRKQPTLRWVHRPPPAGLDTPGRYHLPRGRVGTLAVESEQLSSQLQDIREEVRHLRLQVGVRDLRIQQLRDTLGTVVETLCAMDSSLIPLFPGLMQQVPQDPLFDPVAEPEQEA